MKPRFSVFTLLILTVLMIFLASPVWAQDDEKRGLFSGHFGRSSSMASSDATHVALGASVAFKLFESHYLYAEPGLLINWPRNNNFFVEGYPYPLRSSSKTYIVDFNLSQAFFVKANEREENRFQPYFTGGVGFVKNSADLSDGYSQYNLGSDTHFSKNLGLGFRVFLGESGNFFVNGEWKNYWSGGGNFHVFSGGAGFRF